MSTVTLPWPPAVNNLYLTGHHGKRVRTSRYDDWLSRATACVWQQRPLKLKGRFHVSIVCSPPDKRRRDLDGLAKAPLDLLVKTGVIEDDSLARSLSLFWDSSEPAKPGFVKITLHADEHQPARVA